MKKYSLNELRKMYLDFFVSKGHLKMESFSLIPKNDKSLLLINAGMAPLKQYFTGEQKADCDRITTCQKCIRTLDIDNVGKTSRHGTFFEMLGNFSFGDYFKKEAIAWAWEFLTEVVEIPKGLLYASVYEEDDEAYDIWKNDIGLAPERIFRMGKDDNFWELASGPCGPCSEIYFDRGEKYGCGSADCTVGCNCDRYVELWNLVFTQFNRAEDGSYSPLSRKNIDTGMGLERLACAVQDVPNLFEVDSIKKVVDYVSELTGHQYSGTSSDNDVSIRIITDHTRSAVMMISDGVKPSNEGRGYVLRRLLRRAARHGKLIGIKEGFLHNIAKVVIAESCEAYPELEKNSTYIDKMIKTEEDNFQKTINQGLNILNEQIIKIKKDGNSNLPGDIAFKLHDTYGFPIDITKEICMENKITVDEEGFTTLMSVQKSNAREAFLNRVGSSWSENILSQLTDEYTTEFLGYETLSCNASIKCIIMDDSFVEEASQGDEISVILDKTPFYAESGGQVGDIGIIKQNDDDVFEIEVLDCKKTSKGIFLHPSIVLNGTVKVGDSVKAIVDKKNRKLIAANHSCTHLLQKALRNALGSDVSQAGSYVDSERLRFDFNHFGSIDRETLDKIEVEVNNAIFEALPITIKEVPIAEAKNDGVTALFGEKYGDIVRVVAMGDYSKELCGGTHLTNTSQASCIKILSESGIASGVRRIEALTSLNAIKYLCEKNNLLFHISSLLKSSPDESFKKVELQSYELKSLRKQISELKSTSATAGVDQLISDAIIQNDVKIVSGIFSDMDVVTLRNTADTIKNKAGMSVVILASVIEGKVQFVVMASKDAVIKGAHSGNIIKETAKVANGSGGGRPDLAQAGGLDTSKTADALKVGIEIAKNQIV